MAKSKIVYENIENTEKIEVKKRKIQKLFRELPPEKKQFADGLIYQFAVTTVTLERLVEEINRGELIENFVQGAQRLRRENPALKSCNATIKSFIALSKSLVGGHPKPRPARFTACRTHLTAWLFCALQSPFLQEVRGVECAH